VRAALNTDVTETLRVFKHACKIRNHNHEGRLQRFGCRSQQQHKCQLNGQQQSTIPATEDTMHSCGHKKRNGTHTLQDH
jgi:hypothetical protein